MAQFEISRDGGGNEAAGRKAGVAGAVLARCRARRSRACADLAQRRAHLGADVGGAAADRGATARRRRPIQPGAEQGRASARRHRDPRGRAAASRAGQAPGISWIARYERASTKNQLAVALHYDRTGAPRVIAKGKGAIGAKIIEVAKAHDIPIEENEVLAGALSNVELGDEIPAELYKAVAEVLMFVLRLSGRGR